MGSPSPSEAQFKSHQSNRGRSQHDFVVAKAWRWLLPGKDSWTWRQSPLESYLPAVLGKLLVIRLKRDHQHRKRRTLTFLECLPVPGTILDFYIYVVCLIQYSQPPYEVDISSTTFTFYRWESWALKK